MDSRKLQFGKSKENIPDKKRISTEGSTMIPRYRSVSMDRLSTRKSSLRPAGSKMSIGQYVLSGAVSPTKTTRSSTIGKENANKGSHTPKASGTVRASSTDRASILAPKGSKKDTRSLSDKAYINKMVKKIDEYFTSINQISIFTNNNTCSIRPLTLKMFVDATNLIIKLLDVKSALNSSNYLEEIPKIAKILHYPGVMKESWLKTANTMHSLPHALGWLSWLVELCMAKDCIDNDSLPMRGENETEKEKHRVFFDTMMQCYKAWNEENSELEEHILKEFSTAEAERRGIIPEKYESICADLEEVKASFSIEQQKLNKIESQLAQEEEINSKLMKDYAKQCDIDEEQEKFLEKMAREIEQYEKDSLRIEDNVRQLEEMRSELSSVIKHQPMSISQRDEIVKNCSEQKNYIQNFESHLEEIRKESYSLDMKLATSNKNLVTTILEYNKALYREFSDSGINVNSLLMPEDGQCESNFIEKLENKAVTMSKFVEEQRLLLLKKAALLESQNKALEALQTKRDTLSEQAKKKEEFEEKRKKDLQVMEVKKQEEINRLQLQEEDLTRKIKQTTNQLESISKKLIETIDKRKNLLDKVEKLERNTRNLINKTQLIYDVEVKSLFEMLEKSMKELNE